jgi:hypothetical protein
MTRERFDATKAFYQAWVPNMTHISTFGRQLTKQQKKIKAINVIISDKAKTLHFVGQMYKSNYLTKEQMTKYKSLLDTNKFWDKTLAHFTDLFSLCKAYGKDKAANSGFKSAAHVRDHSSTRSVTTANTKSDFTHNLYIESLEESLAVAWEYCAFGRNHMHTRTTSLRSPHTSTNQTCGATQAGIGSHGTERKSHGSTLQGKCVKTLLNKSLTIYDT